MQGAEQQREKKVRMVENWIMYNAIPSTTTKFYFWLSALISLNTCWKWILSYQLTKKKKNFSLESNGI